MKAKQSDVDRGWAWVVCAAGCIIHIFLIGYIRCLGVLIALVSEFYGRSRRDSSLIAGIVFLMFMLTTPLTMASARQFSVRAVAFTGSLCLTSGFVLSYLATSLELLYFTTGALAGLGLSMMHAPTLMLVNTYFVRYRTAATGLAMAGGPIGAFTMPPLLALLIDEFSLRGGLLLFGGVLLHAAPASMLLLKFVPGGDDDDDDDDDDDAAADKEKRLAASKGDCEIVCSHEFFETTGKLIKVDQQQQREMEKTEKKDVGKEIQTEEQKNVEKIAQGAEEKEKEELVDQDRGGSRKRQAYGSGLVMLASSAGDLSVMLPTPAQQQEQEQLENKLKKQPLLVRWKLRVLQLRQLVVNPRLWIWIISLSLMTAPLPLNFIVLPQHALTLSCTELESTRLLQYQGVSDLITRISVGFIIDRGIMPGRRALTLLGWLSAALWFILLLPQLQSYAGLLTLAIGEGILGGSIVILIVPSLVDAFGLRDLPITYGLIGIFDGCFMFVFPSLLGQLYDISGLWLNSIATVGGIISLSCILLLIDDLVLSRYCDSAGAHQEEVDMK